MRSSSDAPLFSIQKSDTLINGPLQTAGPFHFARGDSAASIGQCRRQPYDPEAYFITAPQTRESVFSTSEVARELSREKLFDYAETYYLFGRLPEKKRLDTAHGGDRQLKNDQVWRRGSNLQLSYMYEIISTGSDRPIRRRGPGRCVHQARDRSY